jgi:hypothetical protein
MAVNAAVLRFLGIPSAACGGRRRRPMTAGLGGEMGRFRCIMGRFTQTMCFVRGKKNRYRVSLCLALMLAAPCAAPSVVRHDPLVLDPVWLRLTDRAWPSAGEMFDMPPGVYGEAPAATGGDAEDDPGFVLQALEEGQEVLSRTMISLSRGMDYMLGARESYADEAYDSLLRLRFMQRLDDAGGSRFEPRANIRLSLPGAKKRWSLIFVSDDFDDPLDRERNTDRELDGNERRSLSLRYLKVLEDWQTSFSVGLRSGDPVDLLTRMRVYRDFKPTEKWGVRPSQSVFWYHERGLGASTELRLEYPLDLNMLVRSNSAATWFHRDERFYYDQVFSLLHTLSWRRGLLWQVGMQAESRPNHHVTSYYAQMRWRSLVHSDWLILEVRPQIIRERENGFRVDKRLYFGFEMLFGDVKR